jgi:hypothetical protein
MLCGGLVAYNFEPCNLDPCLLERSGNPDIGAEFDFAPADRVFVEKLKNGEIAISPE